MLYVLLAYLTTSYTFYHSKASTALSCLILRTSFLWSLGRDSVVPQRNLILSVPYLDF